MVPYDPAKESGILSVSSRLPSLGRTHTRPTWHLRGQADQARCAWGRGNKHWPQQCQDRVGEYPDLFHFSSGNVYTVVLFMYLCTITADCLCAHKCFHIM